MISGRQGVGIDAIGRGEDVRIDVDAFHRHLDRVGATLRPTGWASRTVASGWIGHSAARGGRTR
jgi:hypothetical protein